nr:helix-turn-helix domain-containing protein [Embleya scabrispora]
MPGKTAGRTVDDLRGHPDGSAFRDRLGLSPMSYVRSLRVDRIREDILASADPVGTIAHRWGVSHLLPHRTPQVTRRLPSPTCLSPPHPRAPGESRPRPRADRRHSAVWAPGRRRKTRRTPGLRSDWCHTSSRSPGATPCPVVEPWKYVESPRDAVSVRRRDAGPRHRPDSSVPG